ncbi:MAG: LysM peptidoglycan-binding domain-containing protein, partial [Burkholderiales bacterium]|nr:LysM peptidoglycan-binding domain-containing protein [Burkholderiales bacterium]
PARARLTISLKEYRSLNEQLQQPRRESTDKSKRRQIVGNDSLWALAQREYTDPRHWRTIAEFNDMDDPLDLHAGSWLLLPPLEKSDGS